MLICLSNIGKFIAFVKLQNISNPNKQYISVIISGTLLVNTLVITHDVWTGVEYDPRDLKPLRSCSYKGVLICYLIIS